MKQLFNFLLLFCITSLLLAGCWNDKQEIRKIEPKGEPKTQQGSSADGKEADAAADPSVPDSLGGKGFADIAADLGWQTSDDFGKLGDSRAQKGGNITMAWQEMPPTTRYIGEASNTSLAWIIGSLVYEPLLGSHPKTKEFVPGLATHWKVSEDGETMWFRIDPRAKWADGKPVVADDVLATYKIMLDPGIKQPSTNQTYSENYEMPLALSKYMVEVKMKKKNWRNLLYFSGMMIFPAHYLSKIDGSGFLQKYQWEMIPGTGPYEMNLNSSIKEEQIVLNRRKNYWGANLNRNEGVYNFDEIKWIAVIDDKLRFEKFKTGEYDLYQVSRAQWWAELITPEEIPAIKRGLIQKRKIFNFESSGMSGLAFNIREAPFNDIRVRKAIAHLWNIDELIENLFFHEYVRCNSYFEGTPYANPNNTVLEYNPDKAIKLLAEAGWAKKPGEQWLTKNGKSFELDLSIIQGFDRIFNSLAEDLAKVGIKLNLVTKTSQAQFEEILERQFKISYQSWGGLNIPNPETSMSSKLADVTQTNNITGMKDPKVDALCERYDREGGEEAARLEILREIDNIATDSVYYAMGWIAPYTFRCAYWNKFDMPEWGFPYSSSLNYENVFSLWWVDKEKEKKLEQAKTDESATLPSKPVDLDYWGRNK